MIGRRLSGVEQRAGSGEAVPSYRRDQDHQGAQRITALGCWLILIVVLFVCAIGSHWDTEANTVEQAQAESVWEEEDRG